MTQDPIRVEPYTVLAAGYDLVMEHVDYESWTEYIDHLIRTHGSLDEDASILELGCGTGSLALVLADFGYGNVKGTDRSREMIEVARRKAEEVEAHVAFEVEDFLHPTSQETFDVVLLLYDGLNYVIEAEKLPALFAVCRRRLTENGILIFDQSTPSNSINNAEYFEDDGDEDGFRYVRKSHYDPDDRLHTTTIDIFVDDQVFRETHLQRAYTRSEIADVVNDAGFEVIASHDGFSLDDADDDSERVHWVVRKRTDD
jgi:2-polyprenyl-3-methyl-5-hydroxy-6-metoxy-1,4-benzoquinol methylase